MDSLLLVAGSAVTSDMRWLDANHPSGSFAVILERKNDQEYDAVDRSDHFFLTVRDEARPNSELLVAPVADPSAAQARCLPDC